MSRQSRELARVYGIKRGMTICRACRVLRYELRPMRNNQSRGVDYKLRDHRWFIEEVHENWRRMRKEFRHDAVRTVQLNVAWEIVKRWGKRRGLN